MNKTNFVLYLDMDSVLVDFPRAVDTQAPFTLEQCRVGEVSDQTMADWINQQGARWWANMHWMPDGRALWDAVAQYRPFLLSKPRFDKFEWSYIGKMMWVNKNLPEAADRTILTDDKTPYANPRSILIDDYDKILNKWIAAGGIGILHTSTVKTLRELHPIIAKLSSGV
jgi:hypothetical protein